MNCKEDEWDGEYFSYHDNGQIGIRGFFDGGLEEGMQYGYRRDSSLMWKIHYREGYREGTDTTWHANGQVESVYFWR